MTIIPNSGAAVTRRERIGSIRKRDEVMVKESDTLTTYGWSWPVAFRDLRELLRKKN